MVSEPSYMDDPLLLLRSHDYFRGVPEEILEDVADYIDVRFLQTGELVHAPGELVDVVTFLVAGRIKAFTVDADGREALFGFADPGMALGMNAAAMLEALPIGAVAVEPSTVVRLDYEDAFELSGKYPELRRLWERQRSRAMRDHLSIRTERRRRRTVTIFHGSPMTRNVTSSLVRRLKELGEELGIFSDDAENRLDVEDPVQPLVKDGEWIGSSDLRRAIAGHAESDRIVLDVDSESVSHERAMRLVAQSHQVIWVVRPEDWESTSERLRTLVSNAPSVRNKTCLAWILGENHVAPAVPNLREQIAHDVKIRDHAVEPPLGPVVTAGLERLAHWIRGIRVGVALGGGAARGMAHLGVLKALERGGIPVDAIAGTSAGAMTGIMYAAGLDTDFLTERFVEDLKPGWLFRSLPHGGYWYLMYKYRRGQFDPMLREYLGSWQLEQLPVPCSAVTVDLVRGEAVVRQEGDAVAAILDSINLPLLSHPIFRDGQALIDGGFVNNVPADVLVSQGCNFVIAVDVLAKLEQEFGNVRADSPAGKFRRPNSLQTLIRTYAVQSANMNSIGSQPADVRIEPDVSGFSMAGFTSAAEMATIGEQAAAERLPSIRKLLTSLDARLIQSD